MRYIITLVFVLGLSGCYSDVDSHLDMTLDIAATAFRTGCLAAVISKKSASVSATEAMIFCHDSGTAYGKSLRQNIESKEKQ